MRGGKKLKYVSPDELAASKDIDFYLAKIDDPNEEIRDRALHFFSSLCQSKRVAWYFSPRSSPRFSSYHDVEAFFRRKLLKGHESIRIGLLIALGYMIRLEPPYSVWRIEVIKSLQKILEEIALGQENIILRRQALGILNFIQNLTLLDIGFHILEEPLNDIDFETLFHELKEIMIRSKEAQAKKLVIREKLDELALTCDLLKTRVRKLLEGAPP
jgi:hypothetical protein